MLARVRRRPRAERIPSAAHLVIENDEVHVDAGEPRPDPCKPFPPWNEPATMTLSAAAVAIALATVSATCSEPDVTAAAANVRGGARRRAHCPGDGYGCVIAEPNRSHFNLRRDRLRGFHVARFPAGPLDD
jgi:hypothetical protein